MDKSIDRQISDSIETGSPVETEILRMVLLSATEITEMTRFEKRKKKKKKKQGLITLIHLLSAV